MCIFRSNYEGKFLEAQKAAKAAREAERARTNKLTGQPAELEKEVDVLKEGLLQQTQILSDEEKRMGSVVKRMEKLEQKVRNLEWDNHLLRIQAGGESWKFWKCNNELREWQNWYNNRFEDDLDAWFFNSFAFKDGLFQEPHPRIYNGKRLVGKFQERYEYG